MPKYEEKKTAIAGIKTVSNSSCRHHHTLLNEKRNIGHPVRSYIISKFT